MNQDASQSAEDTSLPAASRSSFTHEVDALLKSQLYRDYRDAFCKASGLPLSLQPPNSHEPYQCSTDESPFCDLMAKALPACAECRALQQRLEQESRFEAKTFTCFAGLCESAAPVRLGDKLIAFLHTGHVLLEKPSTRGFSRIARALLEWGSQVDLKRFEDAYFHSRVLPPAQYESFVRLLSVFADHLATSSGHLALQAEPPAVQKARSFISEHHGQELSLTEVAASVNLSAGYFCELFKEATGLTFIEYLTRVRVEQAKNLLQNPHLRITDIGFRVGFGSISQFNRAFKKVVHQSPRQFRAGLETDRHEPKICAVDPKLCADLKHSSPDT